jgi:hypothetical protein
MGRPKKIRTENKELKPMEMDNEPTQSVQVTDEKRRNALIKHAKTVGFTDAQIDNLGDGLEEAASRIRPFIYVQEAAPKAPVKVEVPTVAEGVDQVVEIQSITDPSIHSFRNRTIYDDGVIFGETLRITRIYRANKKKVMVKKIEKIQDNIPNAKKLLITTAKITFTVES